MKKFIVLILIFSFSLFSQTDFIKGVDVSTLLQIEANGGVYKEKGIVKDPIQIFKSHGINYARLKIWHSPTGGYNNLQNVLQAAKRIKNNGLKLLLDFHYSDTWADPGKQTKPALWNGLTFPLLKDSIKNYTKNVIKTLKDNSVLPDMVQIGNEIICGMLWNDGRICGQYNSNEQWNNFCDLIKSANDGIKDAIQQNDSLLIMIHIDRGGDNNSSRWFFDGLISKGVNFDIIGLSYYPWWHGAFLDLENNLSDLSIRYNKKILITETAYPFTLNWNDNTNNIVGTSNQLLAGYPATVEGQKNFLTKLMNTIKNVPNKNGIGLVYWEPDWISTPTLGSPWENLALFGFNGELLESISVFNTTSTKINFEEVNINSFQLFQNYPNPFNPITKISWQTNLQSKQSIIIYDLLGNEIIKLFEGATDPGNYAISWNGKSNNGTFVPSGVYLYRLKTFSELNKPTSIAKSMFLLK
ncbi:MAG: glycosyl hydrolase 53 family protein [Bacteroidetes bacterium]|nr:glycosyl hydrolase 53 family protein [Bacteroidota bacterium]